ncbi:ABC transporter ATP-binding protein [Aquihabitans sp. McL0605]|uniref:ABC transporter ATP-binding protein n=1 Tax=Aquihabitans sp. McL0605 TaxID=3415671 RepID=UPI003CFA79DD
MSTGGGADQPATSSPAALGSSVYDVLRPGPRNRGMAQLRSALRSAVQLVWAAARSLLILVLALQVVMSLLLFVQVFLARAVLDELLASESSGHPTGPLVGLLVAMGIVISLYAVVLACTPELQRLLTQRVAGHAMRTLLGASSGVDYAAFDDATFEDALLRARISSQNRPSQVVNGLITLVQAVLTAGAMVLSMIVLTPQILPVLILGHLAAPWLARRNADEIHQAEADLTAIDRERYSIEELMTVRAGAKEVRSYRLQRFLLERHERLWTIRIDRSDEVAKARGRRLAVGGVLSGAAFMAAVGVLIWLVLSKRVEAASAATIAVLIPALAGRLRSVGTGAASLYECALFTGDLDRFIEVAGGSASNAASRDGEPEPLRELRVEGLDFQYPGTDRLALHGVSAEMARGQVVALVGENGSGKTTLALLLAGLYQQTDGEIRWNGVAYDHLRTDLLAARIAVVNQDFVRFEMSAAMNIALGRHEWVGDMDRVRAAAKLAGADAFIEDLPLGYDTLLTRKFEGGSQLSGGQWQRIALARALFAEPDLLILDEPSAALDPRAEFELYQRVRSLAEDRTILLISHRLASCRSADRIYVLEEGRVTEEGTHDELIANGGLYDELYRLQVSSFAADAT